MPKTQRVAAHGNYKGVINFIAARDHAAQEVIGVDIDAELVGRSWRHRRDVWSLQAPPNASSAKAKNTSNGSVDAAYLADEAEVDLPNDANNTYFPECFSSLFGPIPISTQNTLFPNNVSFYTSDWANHGCPADATGYDVVIA
ncbi:hypothetical protein FRC10_011833 [Ceratobasidium sp. 414]|nr:hypothetical protein FRC10_011833 [Ceratobasidium sp. 414]